MRMILRLARPEDFDYCARLYFEEVEKELNLNIGCSGRWPAPALGRDAGSDHHARWDGYRLVTEL